MQTARYPASVNDSNLVAEEFLAGATYPLIMSEVVFSSFYTVEVNKDENPGYAEHVKMAKAILDNKTPVKLGSEVYHVPHRDSAGVSSLTKTALVRYINLAYKGRVIISLGEEVLYVPRGYTHVTMEEVELFVSIKRKEYENRSSNKAVNAVRQWAYGLRFLFQRTQSV